MTNRAKLSFHFLPEQPPFRWAAGVAAVLLLLVFAIRLFACIPGNSVTFDESVHVTRGYAVLRYHDPRLNIEHPILGDALAALPLLTQSGIKFPLASKAWYDAAHWVVSDLFLWHDNLRPQHLVDLARGSVAVMAILLAILVAIWAAELYGWKGALFSLILFTNSPTVLANSDLATNDLCLALFSTLYLYLLWRFARVSSLSRGAVAAVALAAALMVKYSSMTLLIDTVVLLAWWWFRSRGPGNEPEPVPSAAGDAMNSAQSEHPTPQGNRSPVSRDDTGRATVAPSRAFVLKAGVGIFLVAGLVVWAAYGFRVQPILTQVSFRQEFGQSLDVFIRGRAYRPDDRLILEPGDALRLPPPEPHNLRWKLVRYVPVPAPVWFRGLLENLMQARGGHKAYLFGRVSKLGWWYYFPVAFLVKTPIPFLLLMGAALWTLRRRNEWDEAFLLVPVAILFATAMKSHIDIGIRHLLPIYPLLAILCGRLIPLALALPRTAENKQRLAALTGLAGLAIWLVLESALIHPLYLTYFNEFVGGPSGGSRVLCDSNLDWGQDLIRLSEALERHRLKGLALAYFGTAEPAAYGVPYPPYDTTPLAPVKFKGRAPMYGWIAVSASEMAYHGGPGGALAWLKNFTPQFTVGHTIRVYHIQMPRVQVRGKLPPGGVPPVLHPPGEVPPAQAAPPAGTALRDRLEQQRPGPAGAALKPEPTGQSISGQSTTEQSIGSQPATGQPTREP